MAKSDWVSSTVVCQALGFSRDHLARLRENGTLKPKHHWRNIAPTAHRPTYRYHLKQCQKALDNPLADG